MPIIILNKYTHRNCTNESKTCRTRFNFFSTIFLAYINFTEINVKMHHEKTPQNFSTGVELVAICSIYVKR